MITEKRMYEVNWPLQETVDIFYYGNELYSDANGIIAQAREVTFREEKIGIYEIHNKESGKKNGESQ